MEAVWIRAELLADVAAPLPAEVVPPQAASDKAATPRMMVPGIRSVSMKTSSAPSRAPQVNTQAGYVRVWLRSALVQINDSVARTVMILCHFASALGVRHG